MKKKYLAVLLLATIWIYSYTDTIVFASEYEVNYTIATEFDYSFTKEEDWKSKSKKDKIEDCQIPIEIAEKMSTRILLESILSNPLMVDLFMFNTYDEGYRTVKNEISAFGVLLERTDLYEVLTEKYDDCCNGATDDDIMNSMYLAVIMAQDDVIKSTDNESVREFYCSLEKSNKNIYLKCVEENKAKMCGLERTMLSYDSNSNYSPVYIYIPRGIQILAYTYVGTDFTDSEKNIMHARFSSMYHVISYISPASPYYNCHSYAWYSQSTSNPYVIEHPHCDAYIDEGIYVQVSQAKKGDIVHWCEGDNSAIVRVVGNQSILTISKFGEYGVYTMYIDEMPYVGNYYFYRN